MDELLSLLEELVINKIRIEKMQNEVVSSQHKRILGNEIQSVSKIQNVIKDIQTTTMGPIYGKLNKYLRDNSSCIDFHGENSKLDNFNEEHLYEILRILIDYIINSQKCDTERNITVSASNDSTNLIIIMNGLKNIVNKRKLIQRFNKDYIPLTYLMEEEVDNWIEEAGLSDSFNSFMKVYKTAKLWNISVEIKSRQDMNEEILISLPISSSIIKAQLIQIDKLIYAIPMDYIEKIMSLNSAEKRASCNRQFIMYMGSSIPVISIYDELNLNDSNEISGYIVLKYNDKMKALPVNSLLDQSDIVIRPKPLVINEIKEFKGTTILGDGSVTMVFDIPYIVENAS